MIDTSRQNTTRAKTRYLIQLPLSGRIGSRAWVHNALQLRVVETRRDQAAVNHIWLKRHYLGQHPTPPRVKRLSYLGHLDGCTQDEAGVAVTIALLAGSASRIAIALRAVLGLHPCNIVELARCWRADDLSPDVAPDLMPYALRRIVGGGNGVGRLADEWNGRKLTGGLAACARLLLTYADPGVGHDGRLYLGAGATFVGRTANGKLGFAWALDPGLATPLHQYGWVCANPTPLLSV